jgi:YfiH family protein
MMFTLPKPNDGFEWVQLAAGPALVCRPVERHATHLFTTRAWRLGTSSSPSSERQAWQDVASAMAVDSVRLARLRQVHGTGVATHHRGQVAGSESVQPEADIVISDDPAMALAVQTADCAPILIADPRARVVAAVHAGWRGLVARAPLVAVERLAADFGSRPEDLVAAVGPAIGWCCYEVGPEVRVQFERALFDEADVDRWFSPEPVFSSVNPPMESLSRVRTGGHWFFDPSRSARAELEAAGVPSARIFVSGLCTASHRDLFCSYRRDGAPAGRMAAAVRLIQSG